MSSATDHRYPAVQGELEDELELEDEFESEGELELEDEFEGEEFLGGLARGALGLLSEQEDEFEFEFEAEAEREDEDEDEAEAFANPVRRVYRDAELMAHLARRASDAEGEQEAEAFLGALVPIAARLVPRAAALLTRNAPALIRGVSRVARQLRSRRGTARLVRALPVVLQRTAQSLADQDAAGRPVTGESALRALVRMTDRVLVDPDSRRSALGAVDVFDRRFCGRTYGQSSSTGGPAYGQGRVPTARMPGQRRRSIPTAGTRRGRGAR